ncbi:hypothetical protein [Desulforhopalus singaporensis]|uniref:Transglycosylase SLT domain-containing protein n=1 Tax=Desulforhopalus singaporensis TaxID=91360 RepID=A0A1H0UM24_9BACT|nr:hypothetical protein [Desulforhopalus singaporensis]SDP66998.1 hypothetical protein SAMN05660330_03624 [Desulforhopalus singaporensis]
MYDPEKLRQIIRTVIDEMGMWSQAAEELLLGTVAHESALGRWTHQIGGPALGIYQMEPATLIDIYDSYLKYRPEKLKLTKQITSVDSPDLNRLQYDPVYSTAMARLHYRRIKDPFPEAHNIVGLAEYWDKHFNRNPRKGTTAQFLENYHVLVLGATGNNIFDYH